MWKFVKDRYEATAGLAELDIRSPIQKELPVYPSLPFSIKVCEALSRVAPAFNDMAMSGELSIQMIDILANVSSLIKDGTATSPITSPRGSPDSRHNLLHSISDLHYLSIMGTTPLEHFLCYGLMSCCYTLHFDGEKIGEDHNEPLKEFEEALTGDSKQDLREKVMKKYRNCLLWIYITSAGALAMSDLIPSLSVVLDRAFEQFPDETSQWDVLARILCQFLCSDDLLRHWRKAWRKAMMKRSRGR